MEDDVIIEEEGQEEPREALRKLRERLKQCESEKQEYLDGWQRSKADFVNAKKIELREREEFLTHAQEKILKTFLPLADHFERAFAQKEAWGKVDEAWRSGVESIYSELIATLKKQNVTPIGSVGDKFDPRVHEPVGIDVVSEPEKDDHVTEVVEKGYTLGGQVIRPAKVKLGQLQA